jgi:predicted DNA-binding transcriptional regulator AlpA
MMLTIRQVAVRYNVSVLTIRRWWSAGLIPQPVRIGKSLRWIESKLEEWIAQRCIQPEQLSVPRFTISATRQSEILGVENVPEALSEVASCLNEYEIPKAECRVYFLVRRGEVTYVGQTDQLDVRSRNHKGSKDFDRVLYIDVPRERLLEAERYWINKLHPKLNSIRGVAPDRFTNPAAVTKWQWERKCALAIEYAKLADGKIRDGVDKAWRDLRMITLQ